MTTCREIVSRAMQLASIVPLGKTPSSKEMDIGMEALQSMYDQFVTGGMFGRLTDVYATADYDASEGERVIGTGITVTLPTTVEDRAPRDLACIVKIIAGVRTDYIYEDGAWVSLTGLAETTPAPLANRNRHGLSAVLAMSLAEIFGAALGPLTLRQASLFLGSLSWKVGSTQDRRAAEYF